MNISIDSEIEISQSEVVEAVMASEALGVSKHQIALFKYLLNRKYNNNLDGIKAYSIAVDVFGRPTDFDGGVDSIVRVEMFRLRANLKAFNQDSRKFHLNLPKASYEIQIKPLVIKQKDNTLKIADSALSSLRQKWLSGWKTPLILGAISTIVIATNFMGQERNDWRSTTDCSDLVPNVSIINKSETTDLGIYIDQVLKTAASQFSHINIAKNVETCRYSDVPGYEIQYVLFEGNGSFRATLTAISDVDERVVVSQNISGELNDNILSFEAVNDDLHYKVIRIANDWLRPHGIIHKTATIAPWKNKEKRRDYSCINLMYESFVSDTDEAYEASLDCQLLSYKRKTPLLDNLGGLAANYLAQALGIRPHTVEDPLKLAVKIMDEVGENWPKSVETTIAKIMLEVEREDYNAQRLRSTLFRAEKIYDSNTTILGEGSKYFGFKLGDWVEAKRVSERMKRLISDTDNSTYLVDAAYALIADSPEDVLNTCKKAYSKHSRVAVVFVNACALKANDSYWIKRTETDLNGFGLQTLSERTEFVTGLNFHMSLQGAIINSWNAP